MLKKIFKIILAFSSWYKLYGKVFQTVEKPVECPSGSNQHMWNIYVFCKHLFYDQLVHHICEASRWNVIGDGHLCKFWMKGHLDITLNRLMLVELILIRYFNIHSLMHSMRTHTHTHTQTHTKTYHIFKHFLWFGHVFPGNNHLNVSLLVVVFGWPRLTLYAAEKQQTVNFPILETNDRLKKSCTNSHTQ